MRGHAPRKGGVVEREARYASDHVRAFLDWLLPRHAAVGGLTEVRILGGSAGVWSVLVGPDDAEALVAALAPVSATPRRSIPRGDHPRSGEAGIYFSLQAVQPSADGRVGLPFRRASRTTRDRDIRAYSIMVVDVDPERLPRDRSATDGEKAEARAVAENIRVWLSALGVPSMLADSGNGWHVLVPLVPATGDDVVQAARDAQRLLTLLDARFSTAGAKVDRSTFNPARILKLYGTAAVKGEDTPEHPHRLSSIDLASIPADTDLFARLAEADLGEAPARPAAVPARREPTAPTDLSPAWAAWRAQAIARLPVEVVYGGFLTGRTSGAGWLQCRDPWAANGDRHPSAGVADGTGEAERGTFHSFIRSESLSVFDFLVQRGDAPDFRAACARVAELAAVPLPRADASDIVAAFRAAWSVAGSSDERTGALRSTLGRLIGLPAITREPALEEVREASGLARRVFLATVAEARRGVRDDRRQRTQASPPVRAGLPVVDFVENRDTVENLFDALVAAVAPACRFFRFERDIVFVRRGFGPRPVDERSLPGLLSALVELRYLSDTEDGVVFQRFDVLAADLARAFVHSPRVASKLPVLSTYARSPVFDRSWNFVGKPGYHPASGIFYDGPEVHPAEGVTHLLTAVQDFPWKDTVDMVNFIGALLTALTMPHWGRGHPFLAINGNKPGVGKSTLARVLGVVAEGSEPTTVTFSANEEEFEKQLATRVECGDRVVVIDNAKTSKPIQSPVLERCITDTRLNFRRLGGNTAISRPTNDVLFVLTMNLTQMGPDLRRRALPLNLAIDGDIRRYPYRSDDPVGDALDGRVAVVAELAGMVAAWGNAGRPIPEDAATHSTSRRWAATIDAILRVAGFDGFLSNFDDSEHAFDPDYALLADVCATHHASEPKTASEWAAALVGGLLEERLTDGRGNAKPARAQATLVGQLFGAYLDGTTFPVGEARYRLRRDLPRKGHPPVYCFEPDE
ncbi:MAG: hypothetical protein Q8P18_28130 [Pseudomonadota bacterium]|nr:hypothetical protein [Pseudomonadota bacterium]